MGYYLSIDWYYFIFYYSSILFTIITIREELIPGYWVELQIVTPYFVLNLYWSLNIIRLDW